MTRQALGHTAEARALSEKTCTRTQPMAPRLAVFLEYPALNGLIVRLNREVEETVDAQ